MCFVRAEADCSAAVGWGNGKVEILSSTELRRGSDTFFLPTDYISGV